MSSIAHLLQQILPSNKIKATLIDRYAFAGDAGFYYLLPQAIVQPDSLEEIKQLFLFAKQHTIPLTFRAAGTSLSGQSITDGILVDLSRNWKKVTPLEDGNFVKVQPAAIGAHVNHALKTHGKKIGPDPASISAAMMGGILSNNSSGMCCGVQHNSYHTLQSIHFILLNGNDYNTADAAAYYEGVFNELSTKTKLDASSTETLTTVVARLTRAYNRQGDKKKAQAVFTRAQQLLGENNPMVNSLLIDGLREEGRYREALDATRTALNRYPTDRSLKLTEAMILGDLHNYNESLEALRFMRKEQTVGDTMLLTIMSNIQLQSGQLKEAEATIRQALELDANDMDLLIQLGSIQDRAGQRAEAEKTLRAVLQREPDNATALNNLGYYLAERSARYNEALPLIEKAVSIEPINGSFLDSLGWVQYKMGRLQEARGHLEKAALYARRNAMVHEHLGDVLRELGRAQEARRNWEVALEYSIEAGVIARLRDKIKHTQ